MVSTVTAFGGIGRRTDVDGIANDFIMMISHGQNYGDRVNKSSGTVLLEYSTGHCLRTVVNDKVMSRLLHICVLAIEIGKRIRSQLKQRDANTLFRIAFPLPFTKLQPLSKSDYLSIPWRDLYGLSDPTALRERKKRETR